jgi:hypothetical protein
MIMAIEICPKVQIGSGSRPNKVDDRDDRGMESHLMNSFATRKYRITLRNTQSPHSPPTALTETKMLAAFYLTEDSELPVFTPVYATKPL